MWTAKSYERREGYITVTVNNSEDGLDYGIDVSIEDNDVSTDWSQWMFYLLDKVDSHRKEVQDQLENFEEADNEAVHYLIEQSVIEQREGGKWYYSNN